MDSLTCGLVIGPVIYLTIMANAFFIFCMVCPRHRERIKQPLKFLLWSLICYTVTSLMSALVLFFSRSTVNILASNAVLVFSLSANMSSSIWLNFYYYIHIVPAQRALFIWIKKNIKPLIFCICLVEMMFCLLDTSVILILSMTDIILAHNFTMYNGLIHLEIPLPELQTHLHVIAVSSLTTRAVTSACVIVLSIGSTVVYLCSHMRHMVANGQPLNCLRFRSQVRVTVTGILQLALHISCVAWTMFMLLTHSSFSLFISPCTFFTVYTYYLAGTTFSLGAGQGIYRRRAADVWFRAAQWCKVPKVQELEQEG